MRKKSLLCYILCVLFLFSLTACAGTQPSASEHGDEVLQATENQDSGSTGEPPMEVRFDSINDIKSFFSEENRTQSNSSAEHTVQSVFQYTTENEAMILTNAATNVYYPVADTGINYSYRPSGPSGPYLNCIDVIDGIQYSFIYLYNCHTPVVHEDEPAFTDIQIGPYTVDLYRMDPENPYLLANIVTNGFVIAVTIRGENHEENFDFSNFDFVQLSSASDHVAS